MSNFFAQVELELAAAAGRRAHLPWYRRRRLPRAVALGRPRVGLVAVAVVLASAAIALAAAGVIPTGTPVPTVSRPVPTVGDGIPAPGGSRLLPLRVADPAGGLP